MTFLPNATAKIYRTTDLINAIWIGFTDVNGRVMDAGGIPPSLSYGDYVITLDHCDYNLETLNFNIPRDTLLAATVGCTSSITTHEVLTTTHGGVLQTAAMKNIASGIAGLDAGARILSAQHQFYTHATGQVISVGASSQWVVPDGIYYVFCAINTRAEAFQMYGQLWRVLSANGGVLLVISDGTRVRLYNTGTFPELSYYQKVG